MSEAVNKRLDFVLDQVPGIDTLGARSLLLCGVLFAVGVLALLLAVSRRQVPLAASGVVTGVLLASRVYLVSQGYVFESGRVRLVDVLLSLLVIVVALAALSSRHPALDSGQRTALAGAALALPVASFAALQLLVPNTPADTEWAACDGAATAGSRFLARTGPDGLNARSGPGTTYAPTRRFDSNCLIGADAYCVGEPVKDRFVSSLSDVRWLRLRHTKEYVTAGQVTGLRPESRLGSGPADDCPEGLGDPTLSGAVSYEPVSSDLIRFRARPVGSNVVGFGARYVDSDGNEVKVDQVGIAPKVARENGLVRADLSLSGNRVDAPSATFVELTVVPCLGPIVPSHADGQVLRVTLATGEIARLPWTLTVDSRQVQAACRLDPTKNNEDFAAAVTRWKIMRPDVATPGAVALDSGQATVATCPTW